MATRTGTKATTRATTKKRSLIDFARAKRSQQRRAACAVCALPDELRAQTAEASDKKIDRRTIREWLDKDFGIRIPDAVFATHSNSPSHREED